MEEEEWWSETEIHRSVLHVAAHGSLRKLRSLVCAACDPVREYLINPDSRRALDLLESAIEQSNAHEVLLAANNSAVAAFESIRQDANEQRWYYLYEAAAGAVLLGTGSELRSHLDSVLSSCRRCLALAGLGDESLIEANTGREQLTLLRDIFGNPFRPVAVAPAWLTSDVLLLARGIYEERAFDRMPILADALQDAGCDNDDVLNHCRGPDPHVRGCWVVDLILGRE